ncbi:MAG: class I SAM-dependent methyltransferase [Candidatus Dormibacteraeota bacterium]|nr:class I SAM-dependent methyltransferase [Candidatus Dormibacteraeota bacterium]
MARILDSGDVDAYVKTNLERWEELAELHPKTAFYDLEALRGGANHLHTLEREEIGGEVRDRSLLHLQCHIGTDSVSLARLGARVTGVDFSARAVEEADRLAVECGVKARFLRSEIATLPALLDEQFDVVYTSWGVLCWQPELAAWARAAAGFVRPGGFLYVAEFHPLCWVFDEEVAEPRLRYPYFPTGEPVGGIAEGSYADRSATLRNRQEYGWPFSLGDLVSELAANGLVIEYLHEFPRCPTRMLDFLVEDDSPGDRRPWWRMPDGMTQLPLSFSLRARRDA